MSYKKIILSLGILIILIIYLIHPQIREVRREDGFKEGLIRFHIRANSDMEEDQTLKVKIRDAILKEIRELVNKEESLEDARNFAINNLNYIKSIAEEVIKKEGRDLPVSIDLGIRNFPTRKYGKIVFPAGEYEALEIVLGEGKGANWWCVMFPPLCFIEAGASESIEVEEELKTILTDDEIDLLLADKESPIILKSKIVEVLEKTKTYLAEFLASK